MSRMVASGSLISNEYCTAFLIFQRTVYAMLSTFWSPVSIRFSPPVPPTSIVCTLSNGSFATSSTGEGSLKWKPGPVVST